MKFHVFPAAAFAPLALLLTTCGSAQVPQAQQSAPAAAAAPVAAPAADALNAHPALWEVSDADTHIYLFGTIHILKPDVRWFGGPVEKAFDSADTLVLEMVEPPQDEMQKLAINMALNAPDKPALSTRFDEGQKAKYIAAMDGLGLPWASFERFKPWFMALTLSVTTVTKLGYQPDSGAEKVLTAKAKEQGKTIMGLETAAQQLGFMDGLPQDDQMAFLTSTVDELPDTQTEFPRMIGTWAQGKPDALAAIVNDGLATSPGVAKALLFDRNLRWADWIKARLAKPGTVFIAVGAGHLAGKNSVLDDLKKLGVKSRRVDDGEKRTVH